MCQVTPYDHRSWCQCNDKYALYMTIHMAPNVYAPSHIKPMEKKNVGKTHTHSENFIGELDWTDQSGPNYLV